MFVNRTRFIGPEGAAFERVGMAFNAYGYEAPSPDPPLGNKGAYAGNIITQYQGSLSEPQVLALIEYGLTGDREKLLEEKADPDLLIYDLDDLTYNYLNQC